MDQDQSRSGLQDHSRSGLEDKFDAAVRVIRSLPEDGPYQPSDNMMLMFYSYYQQATLGPCHAPRPLGFWDSRGKAKWDAWSSLGNMTMDEAMINYVDDIQLILETIPVSEEVAQLVEKLGTFHSEVDGAGDQGEENEVDRRAFTRPFAGCADELRRPKPVMEGFGDLWEDIQNPGEDLETTNDLCPAVCDEERSSIEHVAPSEEETQHNNLESSSQSSRNKDSSDSEISDTKESSDGDDTEEEEEEEEEEKEAEGGPPLRRRRSPYPRLQGWEGDSWSLSSMDPSLSSVTNGVHSSLNSQLDDQELASLEPRAPRPSHRHRNALQNDDSGLIPGKSLRTTDSDNEEFCDSMEHLAMDEVSGTSHYKSPGSRTSSARQRECDKEALTTLKAQEDFTLLDQPLLEYDFGKVPTQSSLSRAGGGPRSAGASCGPRLCAALGPACHCVSTQPRSGSISMGNIHQEVAAALLRLQEDMDNVLHRLHTLESLSTTQSRSPSPRQERSSLTCNFSKFRKYLGWPFPVSPVTALLVTFWPLVAHWLVQLYLQGRRRKTR